MDTYSNVYFSFGGSVGAETPFLGGNSIRIAPGWIVAEQTHSNDGLGIEWVEHQGVPSEGQLESYLIGLAFGYGGGFIGGIEGTTSLPLDNSFAATGVEPGIYSPQIGVSLTWSFFLHNN